MNTQNLSTVVVTFNGSGSSKYHYITDRTDIEIGDTLVVDSPCTGYSTVTVRGLLPGVGKSATKWIVDKVNTEAYEETKRRDAEIKRLEAEIEREKRRVLEDTQLAFLMTMSPKLVHLVDSLRALKTQKSGR